MRNKKKNDDEKEKEIKNNINHIKLLRSLEKFSSYLLPCPSHLRPWASWA